MSEHTSNPSEESGFRPEFDAPYQDTAFIELQEIGVQLQAKRLEKYMALSDHNELILDLHYIDFMRYRDGVAITPSPLALPTLGKDSAKLSYLTMPNEDSPLIHVGVNLFPYDTASDTDDDLQGDNGYEFFFGAEMTPFATQFDDYFHADDANQLIGDTLAGIEHRYELTDQEWKDIVGFVAANIDNVSDSFARK